MFVVLVAALLAPLLVVTMPEVARAADTIAVGPTDKVSIDFDQGPGTSKVGGGASCSVTGYLRLNSERVHTIRARLRCSWGPLWEHDDAFQMRAYGSAPGCVFNMPAPQTFREDTDTDQTLSPVTLVPGNATSGYVSDPDCTVTNVDLILVEYGKCGSDNSYPDDGVCGSSVGTGSWALGRPPQVAAEPGYNGACQAIKVTKPPRLVESIIASPDKAYASSSAQMGFSDTSAKYFLFRIGYSVEFVNGFTPPSGSSLYLTPIIKDNSGALSTFTVSSTNDGKSGFRAGYNVGRLRYDYGAALPGEFSTTDYEAGRADRFRPGPVNIVGVAINYASSRSRVGFTKPAECSFYFGEKFVNDPNSTEDDPAGPLLTGSPSGGSPVADPDAAPDAPGDPDDGECSGFSLTDPSSWAGAGICLLVKMIKAVVDVLGDLLGLVGGLVPALLDGIKYLFIPDPSSWGTGDLKQQLQTRPPGSLVSDTGQIVSNAAGAYTDAGGGCGDLGSMVVGATRKSINCDAVTQVNGFSAVRLLVGLFFGVLTMMAIGSMLGRSVRRSV